MTYAEIVSAYIRNYRPKGQLDRCVYEEQPNLASAIRNAALCLLPSGGKHSHQWRIPGPVLEEAERRLQALAGDLLRAKDFGVLHTMVKDAIHPIKGVGDLVVYDVAHRIGAFLRKAPERVYLHAGTLKGAAALSRREGTPDVRGESFDPSTLPSPFELLSAPEIEDCLCIYKDDLRRTPLNDTSGEQRSSGKCGHRRGSPLRVRPVC